MSLSDRRISTRIATYLALFVGLLMLIVAGSVIVMTSVLNVAHDSNRKAGESVRLAEENRRLIGQRLMERDAQIAQDRDTIAQAIAAITRLANQVTDLGGTPAPVAIVPPPAPQSAPGVSVNPTPTTTVAPKPGVSILAPASGPPPVTAGSGPPGKKDHPVKLPKEK